MQSDAHKPGLGSCHGLFILPELFTGDGDLCEWIQHFENVAVINEWDDVKKLLWLHVSVVGKARVALFRSKSVSYKQAEEYLFERFEPPSKRG